MANYPTLNGNLPNARRVQISSRKPEKVWHSLRSVIPQDRLLPPVRVDITHKETLPPAFENADVIVSLVGIMHGSIQDFEDIQWKGAENVAKCAKDAGARLIHFSAIGANSNSKIPYTRTKGLGEQSILAVDPTATIIRPSLVFGPEDDFFNVRAIFDCLTFGLITKGRRDLLALPGFCLSYPFLVEAFHFFSPSMSEIWHAS